VKALEERVGELEVEVGVFKEENGKCFSAACPEIYDLAVHLFKQLDWKVLRLQWTALRRVAEVFLQSLIARLRNKTFDSKMLYFGQPFSLW
jgi:hypothetical protein